MNPYLLALIAMVVAFAVGFIVYGQIFKKPLNVAEHKPEASHLAMATVGMYLIALSFVYLFDHAILGSLSGVTKGAALGLLIGIFSFAVPLFIDSDFLGAKKEGLNALLLNWVFSFLCMGIIVGLLR